MSSAKDSTESHSEWRKVRKDNWKCHKKAKENSKEISIPYIHGSLFMNPIKFVPLPPSIK